MLFRRVLSCSVGQYGLKFLRRFCTNNTSIMQNAYVRFPRESNTFSVFFHYNNESLGINRNFTLNRVATETVGTFLQRVHNNLERIVSQIEAKRRKKEKKKQKENEESSNESTNITVELFKNGSIVPSDEICKTVLESNELLVLSLTGKRYNVVVNSPWVNCIQLPKCIMSGFPTYPCKFEGDSVERLDSKFVWYKKNDDKWQEVGTGFMFTPSSEDVGCLLKVECEPRQGTLVGPVVEAVSKSAVEAGPGTCPFETRHGFTKEKAVGDSFRVMTYNILAGLYSDTDVAKTELFSHCPTYALDIDYRKQLFMKEILGYKADIICLQEVDKFVFEGDLQPVLSLEGYNGVFHTKGSTKEGIACFVNSDRFRLVRAEEVLIGTELSERECFQPIWNAIKDNEPLVTRVKDKSQTSQATVLQSLDNPDEWIVVGNTHLYFHPDADHIRLLQGGLTVLFLDEVIRSVKRDNPRVNVSLIFCGDFNSTPPYGIYRLMTTGNIPSDYADWKSNQEEAVVGLSISHQFKLASACGTPEFTNFTVGFADCLDYIFYETDKLNVKEIIPLYSESELRMHTALPNVVFPSDHVALVADLKWAKGTS